MVGAELGRGGRRPARTVATVAQLSIAWPNASRVIVRFWIVAIILALAAGGYAFKMQGDLTAAQQQLATTTTQMQASLAKAREEATSNAAARDNLQTEVNESQTQLSAVSGELDQTKGELESVKAQFAQLQAQVRGNRKLAGMWRDLFDYTKDFESVEDAK